MLKFLFLASLSFLLFWSINSLPVKETSTEKDPHKKDDESPTHNLENIIEYERYLKEVVGLLESDPEFRKRLDNVSEADIRTGKIAQELELVDHSVRSKLDELKRNELERIRGLARELYEKSNDIDRAHLKVGEHIDHVNQHTFEVEDLRKLIIKTGEDLAEADRRRREEFKEYELQKEFEKQEKLRAMDEEHRKKYEQEVKEMTEKHNKHAPIHHPGSKDQLEEVWEKQDHMEPEDFDPKKFFMMHDVDGNGFWDEQEVKALFKIELDKVYQQGLPEDDMRERVEEMERMREHVFKEADTNRDHLISFEEFMDQTKRREFEQDQGWETVDQQPQFTHEEYLEFERRRQEEIQRLIAEGRLPAHPNMPNGYYPNDGGHYQVPHPNEIPQYHPNVPPPQYHQQAPQQPMQAHQQQMHQQYQAQQTQQAQANQQMGQNQAQAPPVQNQQQQQRNEIPQKH
ncbi:hypothetical protein PVAND_005402 [Polypedilum vanderplanki]|uniref:EF-hand domain-containing protein n=1 Tax=Polypedilum vanderplanki TaxID=319348 RepID=A0A9J6C0H3_POLVA|nr:hypothetical protein PVAND_005402 [Polypedilum vanderplanki]